MAGRPPKSNKELKASGTYRPDRHSNRLESRVKNDSEFPPHPQDFTPEHIEVWEKTIFHLNRFEILNVADFDSVVTYVRYVVIERQAFKEVAEQGITVVMETKAGPVTRKNPAFAALTDCDRILKALREKFGFTPRDRQSIQVKPPTKKEADPLKALMRKMPAAKTKAG